MIRGRLDRLARSLAAVTPPPTCPECGGPQGAHDLAIIVDEHGRPWSPTCGTCGLLVDAQGRAKCRVKSACRYQKRIVISRHDD